MEDRNICSMALPMVKVFTPFWEYAKSLSFNPPKEFNEIVDM